MGRLGDALRRVLAGVFSRECGLVGPRAPEQSEQPEPLWEPPPVRSGPPPMVTDPVLVGRDADGDRMVWSPPPLGRPGSPRPVFVDETKPPLWGKSAVLQGFARLERLDGTPLWGSGSELHSRALDGIEPMTASDVASLPRSMTIEVRDPVAARSAYHVLWCLRIALAIMNMGGPDERFPALAPVMLLRCIHCGCVLNNPADWPASLGYYRCMWCAAVCGDVAAAERLWGLPVRIAIEWAQRDGRAAPSFPPPNVVRRPVTAPTIECYPRGVG